MDNIIADSKAAVKQIEKFIQRFTPHHKAKIKFYDGEMPVFEHFSIDIEIERALSNQVF